MYESVKKCFAKAWTFEKHEEIVLGSNFCINEHYKKREELIEKDL